MDGKFYQAIMAETNAANQADGMDFRGKKYLTVAKRVEIARRNFGGSIGITTDPVQIGTVKGEPIIFKATITDDKGFVLATGHSWEVIGVGHINATSALENAETSAVGRALAALGIHGGEYASANELRDKPENPSGDMNMSFEEAACQHLSDAELENPVAVAGAIANAIKTKALGYKQLDWFDKFMTARRAEMNFVEKHDADLHRELRSELLGFRETLKKGKAA